MKTSNSETRRTSRQHVLRGSDPTEILANVVLWCSLQILAGAVGECVRLIIDRVRKRREQMTTTLDTIERYSRGVATLEEVWDRTQAAKNYVIDAVTEAVVEAGESAGSNMAGFDDGALDSARRAVTTVIEVGGESMRDSIVEILRRRISPPTVGAFHAAHAERYV